MNYNESMIYLEQSMKFGSRLGLERMEVLMNLLENPGKNLKYIHVAGTNGKGSVTTMIANSLSAGEFRVGVYTSPYVERFAERIRVIDGVCGLQKLALNEEEGEIPENDFAIYMTKVKACIEIMLLNGVENPTEFEIITAIAFMHYEASKCDYVVLETGLGGRLDSTNIILCPTKCVITAIGYDHMDRLGNTIEEISFEKAGIIKKNADVIIYDPKAYTTEDEADKILNVFTRRCQEVGAKSINIVQKEQIILKSYNLDGQKFDYKKASTDYEYERENAEKFEIYTPLLGIYQPMNCAVVIETCKGIVSMEAIKMGIKMTRWPARMELLKTSNPTTFLDGGHNKQGAIALKDTLEKLQSDKHIVFLYGVMMDKEYKMMIEVLLSSDKYVVDAVFCTMPDNIRALKSQTLANSISEILDNLPLSSYNRLANVFFDDDVVKSVKRAIDYSIAKNATFVAFGSLYMAGKVRKSILENH